MHFSFLSAPGTAQCPTFLRTHQPHTNLPDYLSWTRRMWEWRWWAALKTLCLTWIFVCERIIKIFICPRCSLISICIALPNSLVGGRTLQLPLAVAAGVVSAVQVGLVWWLNAALCPLPSCQKLQSSKVFCGSCYFGHFSPSNIEIWCGFWKRQLPLIQQGCFHYKQTSRSRAGARAALCLLAPTAVPRGDMEVESVCQCLQPAVTAPAGWQLPSKPSRPCGPVQIPCRTSASPARAWANVGGESWSTAGWGALVATEGGMREGWGWCMEAVGSRRGSTVRKAPGKINGD